MTDFFHSNQNDCVVTKGTKVGIATKSDMSDVQYRKFWINKMFSPKERVKTFYGNDGALRWVMRLGNLYMIVADQEIKWLAG